MENESINISCFDINGEYNEEVEVDQSKNFLYIESPIRIISLYITENFLQNLRKKESEDKFTTQFSFSQKFEDKLTVTVNCDVISNFSVSHQGTFDSNGYIIFCDLEKNTTFELLEKIINYIYENCSIFIKTYIVGIFKEHIDEDKRYDKMKEFLKSFEFEWDFEYYEMFLGEKNKLEEIKKIHENAFNMNDIFKNIFFEIWKGGKLPINRNIPLTKAIEDKSKAACELF